MKNKFIIGITLFVIIGIVVCLIYILLNLREEKENNKVDNTQNVTSNVDNNENVNLEDNEKNEEIEIVLNSKIGVQILRYIDIAIDSPYSDELYQEIEKNGLSNKAKVMYTYLIATNDTTYSEYLIPLEDSSGSYITVNDFENIAKDIFGNDVKLTHETVFGDENYDMQNSRYLNLPMGFPGSDFNYTYDIPYKIKQIGDTYEVYMYRLYITEKFSGEENEGSMSVNIYKDSGRINKLTEISDNNFFESENKKEYLKNKIDAGNIKKESLKVVKYTLKKVNDKYYLENIE